MRVSFLLVYPARASHFTIFRFNGFATNMARNASHLAERFLSSSLNLKAKELDLQAGVISNAEALRVCEIISAYKMSGKSPIKALSTMETPIGTRRTQSYFVGCMETSGIMRLVIGRDWEGLDLGWNVSS